MCACFFSLSLFDHLPAPGGPEVYEQQTPAHPHPRWDDCLRGTASGHPWWHQGFPHVSRSLQHLAPPSWSFKPPGNRAASSLAWGWGLSFLAVEIYHWSLGVPLPCGPAPQVLLLVSQHQALLMLVHVGGTTPPWPEGECLCSLGWDTLKPPILSNFPASDFPLAVSLAWESGISEHSTVQIQTQIQAWQRMR